MSKALPKFFGDEIFGRYVYVTNFVADDQDLSDNFPAFRSF